MENRKLQPLSDMEKRMSEEHHGLVYSFLHRHGYSIEEFYSIVIVGFLKGIQIYNRREDLNRKYQLAFICEQYMRAEMSDHFKMLNAQKRKPAEKILSLDSDHAETENFYNCTGGKSTEDEVMESEALTEILEILSDIQRKIISLRMYGFSNRETFLFLEIKPSTYYKELHRIKAELEKHSD